MPLAAGSGSYDLSTRALVVGVLDVRAAEMAALCRQAERLVADGADILDVAGGTAEHVHALQTVVAVPLAVADLTTARATGAILIAEGGARAVAAAHSGISPDKIVLDVTPSLRPMPDDLALGYPLLASTTPSAAAGDRRACVLASAALAISRGCRLVRTTDVRGVGRVRDVLAAVLTAADTPAPVAPRP